MTAATSKVDTVHIGLVKRVGMWSGVVCVALAVGTAFLDWHFAWGVALGGGAMLALFALYRWLAPGLFRPHTRRRHKVLFGLIWFFKWPALAVAFYFALKTGFASPAGVAVGVGLIPATAVALVLRALLADARQRRAQGGMTSS